MRSLSFLAVIVLLFVLPVQAWAASQQYLVSYSGTNSKTGFTNSINGTIAADPDTDTVTGSNLWFQFMNDAPIALDSLPTKPSNYTWSQFHWNVTPSELWFVFDDVFINADTVYFKNNTGPADGTLTLYHSFDAHSGIRLIYRNHPNVLYNEVDVDRNTGHTILVGTAIPEPGSFILLTCVLALVGVPRNRFTKRRSHCS